MTELDLSEISEDTLEVEVFRGHSAGPLVEGFDGAGRLIQLGAAALSDLLESSALTADEWASSALLLQLPGNFYRWAVLFKRGDISSETSWQDLQHEQDSELAHLDLLPQQISERVLARVPGGASPRHQECFLGGPATFIKVLARAHHLIRSRIVERCLIGGIDSLVQGDEFRCVHDLRLIRTPNSEVGFFPGEAAAFILLEHTGAAKARGASLQCILGPYASHTEAVHRFQDTPAVGGALAASIAACLKAVDKPSAITSLIVNLNGDTFRARDFGSALVRLTGQGLPGNFRYTIPPESFGEIRAATGAVSLCMGVRSFHRRYAQSRELLISLLDDDPLRGALIIQDPSVK